MNEMGILSICHHHQGSKQDTAAVGGGKELLNLTTRPAGYILSVSLQDGRGRAFQLTCVLRMTSTDLNSHPNLM